MQNPIKILRLDASASPAESASRELGDRLLQQAGTATGEIELRQRDLNQGLSFIDPEWIGANFTPADDRDSDQQARLALSDELIDELKWADQIVLTTPMYNFGVPATLKAWIDLVCRAGITFRYTPEGPQGLLDGKRVDIVITTGGVPLDSPADFLSGYLRQIFGFIGLTEINIVSADRMNVDADASFATALEQIEQSYPAAA